MAQPKADTLQMKQIPRILSLDGGGVRGLSTLLILRDIMEEIERRNEAFPSAKPCHYFDLIGGTGTGGLIAIMLGLFGMTVQECINAYLDLSKEVFKVDQVLLQKIPAGDNQCRFDYKVLEEVMQRIINSRLTSENCSMSDAASALYRVCPTFVVAKVAKHADGPPTVFRSYSGKGIGSSQCAIWQAARATSATPSLFKEMYIDIPRPGINYVDDGLGHNNPAEVALEEAAKLWPTAKHFCLISIGTGHRRAVQLVGRSKTKNDDDDITSEQSLFEKIKSFIPSVAEFMPGGKTATNFPPGVLALIKMAGAFSKLITDSEQVHQRVQRASRSADMDKRFPYFRFNVQRDVGDIGLEEWRKEEAISAHTMAYLQEQEVEDLKTKCIGYLVNPPEFKRMQQVFIV